MTWPFTYLFAGYVVLNILMAWLSWKQFWAVRKYKKLVEHAADLDALLAVVVVQAYMNRHRPIWEAWATATGRKLKVNVEAD